MFEAQSGTRQRDPDDEEKNPVYDSLILLKAVMIAPLSGP